MSHCQTVLHNLRQKGYRITPQREMIIQTIAHSDDHMTAEDIFSVVQQRTRAVNLATIYRTLEMLIDEGVATRIDLGDGKIVYATAEHGPHIHLVCKDCGYIFDAEPQLLETIAEQLQTQYNFTPDLNHISIFGICSGCK